MQFWKNFKNGKVERIEESQVYKHPEKLDSLKSEGYIRINSENDDSPFKKKVKRKPKKKK